MLKLNRNSRCKNNSNSCCCFSPCPRKIFAFLFPKIKFKTSVFLHEGRRAVKYFFSVLKRGKSPPHQKLRLWLHPHRQVLRNKTKKNEKEIGRISSADHAAGHFPKEKKLDSNYALLRSVPLIREMSDHTKKWTRRDSVQRPAARRWQQRDLLKCHFGVSTKNFSLRQSLLLVGTHLKLCKCRSAILGCVHQIVRDAHGLGVHVHQSMYSKGGKL